MLPHIHSDASTPDKYERTLLETGIFGLSCLLLFFNSTALLRKIIED